MKLRRVVPATAAAQSVSGCLDDESDSALLDRLGDFAGERALVLGLDVGIMCELIRRGCREVTELEQNDRLELCTLDVVILPCVRNAEAAACAIAHARRGLAPSGRILVRTAADPSGRLGRAIERTFRLHGFAGIDVRQSMNRAVLTARLPRSGPLAHA